MQNPAQSDSLQGLDLSAKDVLVPWQRAFLFLLIVCVVVCAWVDPAGTFFVAIIAFNILFITSNSYRFMLMMMGAKMYPYDTKYRMPLHLKDSELPTYTILIPLFREAAVIPSLITALDRLHYPKEKLQILLIVEEEDDETPVAIKEMNPGPHFEVVTVPYSLPQTKAKACNYAMTLATGELTCIFDAEDRPDPLQLQIVANAFARVDHDVSCVQCRLCFYNGGESLLTSLFEIEYQTLFTFILPVATHMAFPIPLGGSSNHFRTAFLRKIGCWDPYNVTEDADLGLRLSLTGHRANVVYSYTPEEAPIHLKPWIKQRSRWLKGYFHTFLVYFRYPYRIMREFKLSGLMFFVYIMFLSPLLTLCAPISLALSVIALLGVFQYAPESDVFMRLFTWTNLFYTIIHFLFSSYMVTTLSGHKYLRYKWLIYIFYFLLHTYAAIIAVYKLIKEPHKWDKTTHGVTKVKN